MKWIIDISEEMRTAIEQGSFGAKYNIYDLVGCVMNGTPLPKGHGRIIDESKITTVSFSEEKHWIEKKPVIIFFRLLLFAERTHQQS